MYKLIQRNKKALLAVFGVLLMIVFLLPAGMKGAGGGGDTTYGKMGDQKITRDEVNEAHRDIEALRQARSQAEQTLRMAIMMQQNPPEDLMVVYQAGMTVERFKEKSVTYVLLQKEAENAGLVPPAEEVEQFAGSLAKVMVGENDAAIRGVAKRYLLVQMNANRVHAIVKPTLADVQQYISGQQEPIVNAIEVKVDEFMSMVPAPTPEQIEEAYNKYAAEPPDAAGSLSATRPVRFGYLLPDQYKLQYLRIPRDKLMETAVATLTPAELRDVDRIAIGYYDAHQKDFADTSPNPEDFILGPHTRPSTRPTTRPFSAAAGEIRRKLILGQAKPDFNTPASLTTRLKALQDKVNQKADELQVEVVKRFQADFERHRRGETIMLDPVPATRPTSSGSPSTQPATQPAETQPAMLAAQPAPPFESQEYLEAVLTNVLAKTGVDVAELKLVEAAKATPGFVPGPTSRPTTSKRLAVALDDKWYTKPMLKEIPVMTTAVAGPDQFVELVTRPGAPEPATNPSSAPTTGPSAAPTTAPATSPSTSPATTQTASASPTTAPATRPVGRSAWALFQPSQLLTGPGEAPPPSEDDEMPRPKPAGGDGYVFRLTGFEGHRVPPLDEVRTKIVEDLKLSKAYALARDEAEKLRKAGEKRRDDPEGGLPDAASLVGKPLLIIGPIARDFAFIPNYDLPDQESRDMFHRGALSLVSRVRTSELHPSTLIDLPTAKRVVAAELRSVVRPWTKDEDYARERQLLQEAQQQELQNSPAIQNWFKPEEVAKRTKYESSRGD